MGSTRRVVDEERLVGRRRIELLDMRDRLVCHVGDEIVIGLANPWRDLGVVAEQIWRPLIGLAALEAVEIIEAHSRRPLIIGTGHAELEVRRVMILAVPRRGKTIAFED